MCSSDLDVLLRAGNDVTVSRTGMVHTLDSDHAGTGDRLNFIRIQADTGGAADAGGGSILIEGTLLGQNVVIQGGSEADHIELRQMALLAGHTRILGLGGADTVVIDRQPTLTSTHNRPDHLQRDGSNGAVRDTLDIDGGEGTDTVTVRLVGGGSADILINVHDTGVGGADTLTLKGTERGDSLLLRRNFVALLQQTGTDANGRPVFGAAVERVNYDASMDGGLTVNGGAADERFYVDDNSTVTTIDGGAGNDLFQIGQLFGTLPNGAGADARVVASDAQNIDLTSASDDLALTRTTRGWVSAGVSHATTVLGGAGRDSFGVFHNLATLQLAGESGDDDFTLRALLDAGTLAVLPNAAVSIDGGEGFNRTAVLGTEASDAFVHTGATLTGAGFDLRFAGAEEWVEIDGQEADDHFSVLGTLAGVVMQVIGGLGSDSVEVGNNSTIELSRIAGPLLVEGGVAPRGDRSVRAAVMLPTETTALPIAVIRATDESKQADQLTVFNSASARDDRGTLTAATLNNTLVEFGAALSLSGLGMGPGSDTEGSGITFDDVEITEIVLGRGNDSLAISATPAGTPGASAHVVTLVHGGGGSDAITVTGGGGAASPLIVFGDTSQDGSRYAGTAMGTPGNDTLDFSANAGTVVAYGGGGNDTLRGSQAADQLAGGSGNDQVFGLGGNDHLYGDSGFNVSLTVIKDANDAAVVSRLLTVVTADASGAAAGDSLVAGTDTLDGGAGDDIVLGDHGVIALSAGATRLLDASLVLSVAGVQFTNGAADSLLGGEGRDILIGGAGGDTIDAGAGNDLVFGDQGQWEVASATFTSLNADATTGAGDDTVRAGAGDDVVLGGQGNDLIYGDDGDDDLIGGHNVAGGLDGADRIDGGAGNDVIAGDNATVVRRADTLDPRYRSLSGSQIYSTSAGTDGAALLADGAKANTAMAQRTVVLLDHVQNDGLVTGDTLVTTPAGRYGNDQLAGGAGNDLLFGQLGDDVIQGDGSISLTLTVGARRDPTTGLLAVTASSEAATDGDDYIEGNGGNDVVFGNLGQDDLIGGSSNLFGLTARSQRADGSDLLFGGAGTDLARDHAGDTLANKHARDADMILGDNGNIFRLVTATVGAMAFAYDQTSTFEDRGTLRVAPRAAVLLDYTAGGADFNATATDRKSTRLNSSH